MSLLSKADFFYTENPRIIVYSKSKRKDLNLILSSHLKSYQTPFIIKRLENQGREGESYLQHFTRNYDHLADFTITMQAKIDLEYYDRVAMALANLNHIPFRTIGFYSLGYFTALGGCNGEGLCDCTLTKYKEFYSNITGSICKESFYVGYFLVNNSVFF